MKGKSPIFINRERELEFIRTRIRGNRPKFLLSVFGEGGVGKTSLLQQVNEEFRLDSSYTISSIDFDPSENRNLHYLRQALAETFSAKRFEAYRSKQNQLLKAEASPNIPEEILLSLVHDCKVLFFNGVSERQKGYRRLLLCDTFELIQDTDLFNDFIEILQSLENTSVLIAGRNNQDVEAELRRAIGGNKGSFAALAIQPFEQKHSEQYFIEVLGDRLDAETRQKLHLLSRGKPIMLELASTWLLRRSSINGEQLPPWRKILELPLADIEAHQSALQERFEYEIVGPLRDFDSIENRAILCMALMVKPFDQETARALLNIDDQTAKELIDSLASHFFVRANMTLHDEMRKLVIDKVWTVIDVNGEIRERYLRKLLELAETPTQKSVIEPGWDQYFREAEILHYYLLLNIQHGFNNFVANFDRSLADRVIERCQLLLQTIESVQHQQRLTSQMHLDVWTRKLELYRLLDQVDRVEREYKKLTQRVQEIPDELRMEALSLSAFMLRSTNPQESIRRYEEALQIARDIGDEISVARILNYSGMVKRRLGLYKEAAGDLEMSIKMADKQGQLKLKAAAMNNLAYVYRQRMEPDLQSAALNWALTSHVLRVHINDREGLAYSKQTLGEIYRDYNDLSRATNYFSEARRLFESLRMDRQVAQVDLALANIDRKEHRPQEAEETLQRVIPIFLRLNDDEGLSSAFNEYGCELRKRGREKSRDEDDQEAAQEIFAQAEANFLASMEYPNAYRRADNLSDMALLYYYWLHSLILSPEDDEPARQEMRRKAQDAAHWAIELARENDLVLPESRALESLGDLCYYAEKKYLKAFFNYYLPACLVMAKYYGSDLFRYRVVFDRVKRRLLNPAIDNDQIRYIAQYMARRWQEEGWDKLAAGFANDFTWIADNWGTGVL